MWWAILHLLVLVITAVGGLYIYFQRQYSYWKTKAVPYEPPMFPYGNVKGGSKKYIGVIMKKIYLKSRHESFYGLWTFHKPSLLINDLDLVRDILVKDFMHFHDRRTYYDENKDPLSAHLFAIDGVKWRNIRTRLTPTFTSGKMRMMFPLVKTCGEQLKEVLQKHAEAEDVVEMKDLIARFSTDVISSCAFGIEANSLKNPNALLLVMGRKFSDPTWPRFFKLFASFILPDLARIFKLRTTPVDFEEFFLGTLKETMEYREKSGVKRKDFLQLLMQLMAKGYVDDVDTKDSTADASGLKFTFEEAAAQAFVFYLAGFETSSAALQFTLYELALNDGIQERLRQEVQQTLAESNGELTYENVHKMEYLGRVIQETLRKYPPVPVLDRVCTKPYKIPGTEIVLEKGTGISIPVYGIHMDDRYYPDPKRFDPERFVEEAKNSRHNYSYLPFGEGPRVCIGQRFAMMQMRVALAIIVASFRVSVAFGKTAIPVKFDPKSFFLGAKGGMNLRVSLV